MRDGRAAARPQHRDTPAAGALGRWAGGVLVVAAVVVVLVPSVPLGPGRQVAAALVLGALTLAAARSRSAPALRAVVYLDVVFAVFTAGSLGSWPPAVTTVLVCVLPLVALLACERAERLRPAAPWLRAGRRDPGSLALGAGVVVLAGGALACWALVVRPRPAPYLLALQELPIWMAVGGVVAFALVNPVWEEALFRGVLLEELSRTWGVRPAVVAQAVVFGAAHWAGFPSGWVGVLMAAAWGLALGVIRVRTGGVLVCYLVHVGANAVIGVLALLLLT